MKQNILSLTNVEILLKPIYLEASRQVLSTILCLPTAPVSTVPQCCTPKSTNPKYSTPVCAAHHMHNNTMNYLYGAAFHCCVFISIATASDHRVLQTSGHEWECFHCISSVCGPTFPSYFSGANTRLSLVVIKDLQLDLHTTDSLARETVHP